jgi:ATPase subunit of ABC transporter with duplicated ATPase domains
MKIKQLEKLVEIEKVEDEAELVLKFPKPYCRFDPDENIISVKNLSYFWPGREEDVLFENVEFSVTASSRIAIVGRNGCGKTSLLSILSGEVEPTSGGVKRHVGSRITVLQQHHYKGEQLDPNLNAIVSPTYLPHIVFKNLLFVFLGTFEKNPSK